MQHVLSYLSQAEGDVSGAWSSTQGSRALLSTTVTKRDLAPLGLYRFRVRGLHGIDGGGGEPGPFSTPSSLVRCGALSEAEQAAAAAAGGAGRAGGAAAAGEAAYVGASVDQAPVDVKAAVQQALKEAGVAAAIQRAEAVKSAVKSAVSAALLEERQGRARCGRRAEEAGEPELGEGEVEEEKEGEEEGEESGTEGEEEAVRGSSAAAAVSC